MSEKEEKETAASRKRAALAGFIDAVTLGAAPRIAAGQQQFENPLLAMTAGTGVGLVDVIRQAYMGSGRYDKEAKENLEKIEEAVSAHPASGIAGMLMGASVFGKGLDKAAVEPGLEALGKAGTLGDLAQQFLEHRLAGRALTSAAVGSAAGAGFARNHDEAPEGILNSAGWGGLASVGGQAVFGELAPKLVGAALKHLFPDLEPVGAERAGGISHTARKDVHEPAFEVAESLMHNIQNSLGGYDPTSTGHEIGHGAPHAGGGAPHHAPSEALMGLHAEEIPPTLLDLLLTQSVGQHKWKNIYGRP